MTKNDLIKVVAKKNKISRAFCEQVFDTARDEILDCLMRGEKVLIKNFIGLEVKEYGAYKARDPVTDTVVTRPPRKSVKCKVSPALKNVVNGR